MRIQAKDLPQHLKRGLAPLYFVFGEEPLHHQESVDAIRAEAKQQGYTERDIFEITAHFEWGNLLQSLDSQNLFSEKRLIECRLLEGKIGKTGTDTLNILANSLLEQNILLFTAGKIDSKTQTSGWFTTLDRKGQVIWARTLSSDEHLQWLKTRCVAAGFQPTADAIQALLERTEGNCLAAAQIIEKLNLLHPNTQSINPATLQTLTLKDVLELVEGDARFSLYDLVDTVLSGSLSRTTRIFSSLKNEGTDPILILWAIARELRAIIPLARQIKSGSSEREVFNQHGVWKRREALIRQCIQRFSLLQLHHFLTKAKNIDDILKGRIPGNGWSELLMLCLTLAGLQTGHSL
jgi:DNA polymerase-3 subunit delta